MGGGQRTSPYPSVGINDLVYRTEDKPQPAYSDEYTKRQLEEQKKKIDDLMKALARLGVVDQMIPEGMVPRVPYRPIEQEFGF